MGRKIIEMKTNMAHINTKTNIMVIEIEDIKIVTIIDKEVIVEIEEGSITIISKDIGIIIRVIVTVANMTMMVEGIIMVNMTIIGIMTEEINIKMTVVIKITMMIDKDRDKVDSITTLVKKR